MTRRLPRALACASLLIVVFILYLTVTSIARATTQGGGQSQKACSEGCHEPRDRPRPDWHPDIGDRSAEGDGEGQPVDAQQPLTRTILVLSTSARVTAGEPVTLTAALHDIKGAVVPEVPIHFLLAAEFAGTNGLMEIGVARTDARGAALLHFLPTVAQRRHVVTARFEGTRALSGSEQRIDITSVGEPPSAYVAAPVGLEAVGQWALAVFVAALVGVWVAFGYVLYQGYAIWRRV